jgi:hypothetical protein
VSGLLDVEGATQHLSQRMGETTTVRSVRTLQYRGLLPYPIVGGGLRWRHWHGRWLSSRSGGRNLQLSAVAARPWRALRTSAGPPRSFPDVLLE